MKIVKPLLFAISFLTIIPVRKTFNEEDIKQSIKLFPLVGLFIGLILFFLSRISIEIEIKSLIVLFVWEFLTGFFHLDGLADTSDAIFSSRMDKEKLFEIMSDSNIGTMGVVIIFFILIGKFILLKKILMKDYSVILVVPVVGRFAINFLSWRLNYAKEKGLGKFICENNSDREFSISLFICLIIILFVGVKFLFPFILILLLLLSYSYYFSIKFGGATGDIFGFSVETIELFFMLLII